MSWGERSCEMPCRCPDKCTMETCNVDCPGYRWDRKTKPDSLSGAKLRDCLKPGDVFSPSIHVTKEGAIGINCGGYVIVLPVEKWHEAMREKLAEGVPVLAERQDEGIRGRFAVQILSGMMACLADYRDPEGSTVGGMVGRVSLAIRYADELMAQLGLKP